MERLQQLIDLCKERQALFVADGANVTTLFNSHEMEFKLNSLSRTIRNKMAEYKVSSLRSEDDVICIKFESLESIERFTSVNADFEFNEISNHDMTKFEVDFPRWKIRLYCYEYY
ncbi:hypothetical protein P9B03_04085 [Metasolibacillus meyeri]|uniref:Uncharacterized protein n=1 Tax=Metasolibacillus meyeri TaxID=1071052 RepID=A0AAW9NQS1_9BACL|nr:hypothetical protein [Metasolibacillus meyeri]MEC1177654.1 hypothetical protein [Metasolibacillus meyeri]